MYTESGCDTYNKNDDLNNIYTEKCSDAKYEFYKLNYYTGSEELI